MEDLSKGKCPVMHGANTEVQSDVQELVAKRIGIGHSSPARYENQSPWEGLLTIRKNLRNWMWRP